MVVKRGSAAAHQPQPLGQPPASPRARSGSANAGHKKPRRRAAHRAGVWLRSYAHDFGDTIRFEKYSNYMGEEKYNEKMPTEAGDFAFPHGFYEEEAE